MHLYLIHNVKYNKIIFLSIIIFALASVSPALATYGVQTKTNHCAANEVLQDSACSPGAILTTSTVVICKSGYTATVRDVPLSERKQVFKEYNIPYALASNYEVDHIISLELGGSNNIANLFPESYLIPDGARVKDKLENYLNNQVCSGRMTIQEAQEEISSNWLKYYQADFSTSTVTKPQAVTVVKAASVNVDMAIKAKPYGATAKCNDGTYSFSETRKGTCSRHGGVTEWY